MSAEEIIVKLKSIFAKTGVPQTLMSDNGTKFFNETNKKFDSDWGFQHKTSHPHYAIFNGSAERYVVIVKNN